MTYLVYSYWFLRGRNCSNEIAFRFGNLVKQEEGSKQQHHSTHLMRCSEENRNFPQGIKEGENSQEHLRYHKQGKSN